MNRMVSTKTTFQVSPEEKRAIKKAAEEKGMYTTDFVLDCFLNRYPVKKIPFYNKKIERKELIPLRMSEDLAKKIIKNQNTLSYSRAVKKWELLLFCCLDEIKDINKDK